MGYVANKIRANTARRNGKRHDPRKVQAMFHRLLHGTRMPPGWRIPTTPFPSENMPSAKAQKEIYRLAEQVVEGSLSFKDATELTVDVWYGDSMAGERRARRFAARKAPGRWSEGLTPLPQTFEILWGNGETWEVDKRGPSHAIYRIKGDPWRAERIFVGDSEDHGPNVVAFWDEEHGGLVDASVESYDSTRKALQALTSGSWYTAFLERVSVMGAHL